MPLSKAKQISSYGRVKKVRRSVLPGEVYVAVGDVVGPDTVIAKTELDTGKPQAIHVASYFGVAPESIVDLVTVKPGDFVEIDQELANYKSSAFAHRRSLKSPFEGFVEHISLSRGEISIREKYNDQETLVQVEVAKKLGISPFFLKTFSHVRKGDSVNYNSILASTDGMVLDAIRSPARGIVEKICTKTGSISIRKPYNPIYTYGYIGGKVVKVIPNQGAVIESKACFVQGVFGVGNETFGELVRVSESASDIIEAAHIDETCINKVLLGGAGITLEAMKRAQEVHARGVIVGGIRNYDIVSLLGNEMAVGITGQEEMDFTLIATEGFGFMPMLNTTFNLLSSHVGRVVSMNGTTQIRAGVIRPEIIISLADNLLNTKTELEESSREMLVEPRRGLKVRVLTGSHYGKWGILVSDTPFKRILPTGVEAELYSVELESGQQIEVLENNLLAYQVSQDD